MRQDLRRRGPFKRFDNIPYGDAFQQVSDRCLDLVVPNGGENLPSVILVHGGSWCTGNRKLKDVQATAEWLAGQGIIAAPLDYRLVPKVSILDQISDVASGVAWLYRHVAEYGGDPKRIYLLGHSSGAHVCAMAACDRRFLAHLSVPSNVPAGIIGLAGMYDVRDLEKVTTPIGRPAVMFLFKADAAVRNSISPILFVRAGLPRFILFVGEEDKIIQPEQSLDMAHALREVGVEAKMVMIPHRNHLTILTDIPKSIDFTTESILKFIQ